MQLNPHIRLASQFTSSATMKFFSACASDLGFRAGVAPYGPLYDDACDVGITIDNPETGNRTHWHLEEQGTDEGDIQLWKFKPTHETLRAHPKLAGWVLTIFND